MTTHQKHQRVKRAFDLMGVALVALLMLASVLCGFYVAVGPRPADVGAAGAPAQLIEVEERLVLSDTNPTRVCAADGRDPYSFVCVLEEDDSDETIYRGGVNVSSSDGLQYCESCRLGPVISGDSRWAYLLATSNGATMRCVCGYR